jgi:acetyl esterase/lipase
MQELNMDVYMPPGSDDRTERPVIVFIHGGGFSSGSKENSNGVSFLGHMVRKGYIGVSIEYRLTAQAYPDGVQYIFDAVEDARAAVRFLHKNHRGAKIDTSRIALMGYSAGAFTANTYAYVNWAQYEGESGNAGYPDDVALVVSLAGAMQDANGQNDSTDFITGID